jgi:NTE family protein
MSDMSSRGVVLAGGGLAGIAWELGVLVGLREAGVDVRVWDRIVGTSAGSIVGAAAGRIRGLDQLLTTPWARSAEQLNEYIASLDPLTVARINELWFGTPAAPDQQTRAEIGRLAVSAHTDHEYRFLDAVGGLVPDRTWPRNFVTTAVDAVDGTFATFDSASGADLLSAVAASCAIPGIFPPITIGRRRYIDGGVRSATSADLAAGLDVVVVISPTRTGEQSNGRQLAEVAQLRGTGSAVIEIGPDAVAAGILAQEPLPPDQLGRIIEAGVVLGSASGPVVEAGAATH